MAEVAYKPRGRDGFECTVEKAALALTVSGTLEDVTPAVHGDLELTSNAALVTNAWAYAKHEAYRRRLRSAEKRKSHAEQAEKHKWAAAVITDLVSELGDESRQGWCSACFSLAEHRAVRRFRGPTKSYLCGTCGAPTTACAAPSCKHMSNRGTSGVTKPRYCAQHRHEITGFEKAGSQVGALDNWSDWLSFESRNLSRTTKVVGAVVLTAAVVTPAAWAAAPAIGGALGGMTGLTGAAATSHGLAMLGGGSVASGGLGMAGGTAVVSAVGGGLGGVIGGTATAAYVGADPSFKLQKLRDGTGAPVLVASGFLTDKDDGWGTWKRLIDERYPDRPVYRVHWGAKELKVFGTLAAAGAGSTAAMAFARRAASTASRKAAGRASWFGWLLLAKDVAANPWTVAKTRAGMTGAVLADLIARTDEPALVLVGHSLGARVVATTAQLLGTRVDAPKLEDVHLLGAAVGAKGDWRTLNDSVTGSVWNYWSTDDMVLKYLYAMGSAGERAAGQAGFGTKYPKIKNRNVSRGVDGHSAYFGAISLGDANGGSS
ncbi:DUF726 domain-containing protein [Nocardioides sediminis]|uniref:DUF726 domain-containing protein n=1 Tax=Nocardioides sediminis TaxID=433648 RepID=UPI000D31A8BF|nr:DUF726 domain-containing protein [Nocardioides sediminis]